MRWSRSTGGIALLACATMFAARAAHAADLPAVQWLTPEGVHRQLEQPVSISWSGVPVRQALASLSRSQRVAILLDRRVDPDQEIELSLSDISFDAALKSIALRLELGVSRVGAVIYLGPPKTADRLRTLVELRKQEIGELSPAVRSGLLALKRCRWESLSTPRELLADAAREYRVRIEPIEKLPHDLWPAADLPATGLADRVSMIAAQFDLTFELADGGKTLRLVPMPETAVLEKTYNYANPGIAASRLRPLLKSSNIETANKKFNVRGPAEEHELVESILAGKLAKQTTVTPGQKVYQLNIATSVGRLIRQLGPKLELTVEIDEEAIAAAGLSLDKEVNVTVKDVSEDVLLRAVLEPAGLTYERREKTLVVKPKEKPE